MKRLQRSNDDYAKLFAKTSDSEGEETELFIRKQKKAFKEIPTIEKIVEEGDTLQSLSIRYRCSIAELKRLNNIHKENEIFARNKIKVPARPFSEAIAGVHDSGNSSPNDKEVLTEIDSNLLESKLDLFSSNDIKQKLENDLKSSIFNSNIKPPDCQEESFIDQDNNDVEHVRLLSSEPVPVVIPVPSRLMCNGADGDISFTALVICIVVLIVIVPLIYSFYVAEHVEEYHHPYHPLSSHSDSLTKV